MKRRSYLAGNWKMNFTVKEARTLAEALVRETAGTEHKVMVAPPFTALQEVSRVLKGSHIVLGAQNMASEVSGAHTGEVSVLMLKDLGVETVIIGHSERRSIYGETDELINRKVRLALEHGMEVILCVGETLEQREAGQVNTVVEKQTREGLQGIPAVDLSRVVIAYEPVWAIGTGKTATPGDAEAVHKTIRGLVSSLYGEEEASRLIIQYGGSVKPDNVSELMAQPDIDGALVGGASLKKELFVPVVRY